MNSTHASLLDRLKQADAASPEWQKLHDIYAPLILYWLHQIPGADVECDDLAQEVLIVLVRELPAFESRGKGSFRGWLKTITVNQTRAYFKRRRRRPQVATDRDDDYFLAQLEDPQSALSHHWDREHDRHVSQKLLQLVKNDFESATWEAFCRFALEGRRATQVAAEMGISENAVLLAKSRVLKRLRQEAGAFLS